MNCFDFSVASKVSLVERQNPFDAMYAHGGHQSRIVNLGTGDIVHNEQSAPFLVHGQTIRQQPQIVFKQSGATVGFGGISPYPLRLSGRVQVFQNSATFCDV
jgi:hypothetical protein